VHFQEISALLRRSKQRQADTGPLPSSKRSTMATGPPHDECIIFVCGFRLSISLFFFFQGVQPAKKSGVKSILLNSGLG
jgi:hypothetical protein